MGNIMDYISWRGDLSFEQAQFNEVDNLILACFSYVNLEDVYKRQSGCSCRVQRVRTGDATAEKIDGSGTAVPGTYSSYDW